MKFRLQDINSVSIKAMQRAITRYARVGIVMRLNIKNNTYTLMHVTRLVMYVLIREKHHMCGKRSIPTIIDTIGLPA